MLTFNTDNMVQQKFPFPAPIMDYIYKNITGSQALKLYKTCKWFYDKFCLNILEDFEICAIKDDERMVGCSVAISRLNRAQLNNVWVSKSFTYYEAYDEEIQPLEFNYGMFSRLTYDTLHILSDITVKEFEFLVQPDTLRNLVIGGRIHNPETGQNLSIEDCIELAPHVTVIELFLDRTRQNAFRDDSFPPLDMTKLISLERQTKLTSLQLSNVSKVPDSFLVIEFLKKHAIPEVDYYFDFDKFDNEYNPDNIKEFYQTVNAELRAWRLSLTFPPIISSSFIDLTGKNAIITGAGEGIGKAATILFRQLGASVIAVSKNRGRLDTLAKECENIKNVGLLHIFHEDSLNIGARLIERINYRFGTKFDILVNNDDRMGYYTIPLVLHGEYPYPPKISILRGYLDLMQYTKPYLIESNGCIINVPTSAKSRYAAAIVKVEQRIKNVEDEFVSSGVRINTVNPGNSDIALPRPDGMNDLDYKKLMKDSKKIHDEQAANAIAFLASGSAKLINQSTMNVNHMNLR